MQLFKPIINIFVLVIFILPFFTLEGRVRLNSTPTPSEFFTLQFLTKRLSVLQVRHRYEIAFTFESRHIDGQLVIRNPDASCPSLYCHVTDLRAAPEPGHYLIVVELFAHKEKLLKEQVHLHSDQNPSQSLTLAFHARVLGKGKGTPFLKNGIKSIGQQMDEDDEDNSDWPGFG